jgi:hypothetical protein
VIDRRIYPIFYPTPRRQLDSLDLAAVARSPPPRARRGDHDVCRRFVSWDASVAPMGR